MPLAWEALAGAHPLDFRITNVLTRLEKTGDRWHNALLDKQSLEQVLEEPSA
jgi:bifunctional non-homologous end joining protein LigD